MTRHRLRLTPQTAKLFRLLDRRGDVPILDLYAALSGDLTDDVRRAQQWLSSYRRTLNHKLKMQEAGLRMKPGRTKQTYRLVRV